MNKKTINMDDIIRFYEGYENDEFMDEEILEEEFIQKNSFSDSRVNFEEENFINNSFYGEGSRKEEYSEELIFNLGTLDEDDECEYHEDCHQEYHKKRYSNNDEDNEYNTARAYYTECNYSCGCGDEETTNVKACEDRQDDYEECNSKDDGYQKAYDEGYENGYTAAYEKAKQEVRDYINKRNKKNKCCRRCCCRNN